MRSAAKSSRIGDNPLDAIMPKAPVKKKPSPPHEVTEPKRAVKVRATFHISEELFESVRDAVVALSGPPDQLTLAGFAENALRSELARLAKERNKGRAFPKRGKNQLRVGRPIGS